MSGVEVEKLRFKILKKKGQDSSQLISMGSVGETAELLPTAVSIGR
jgi:hypothetical protein